MRQGLFTILVIFSILIFYTNVQAFYCGNTPIQERVSKFFVLSHCGAPDFKERVGSKTRGVYDSGSYVEQTVSIEKWTYNFGPNDFIQVLTFVGNTLIKIESAGRGFAK